MSTADTYVRARISSATKRRAAEALGAMGLSVSDAIRLLMLRVAEERCMPFEIKAPNTAIRKTTVKLEDKARRRFNSAGSAAVNLHAKE
jgi:DNA-damage-inducible protein J